MLHLRNAGFIGPAPDAFVANAIANDLLICACNLHSIHLCIPGMPSSVLRASSNGIDVQGNINFTGGLFNNGVMFNASTLAGSNTTSGNNNSLYPGMYNSDSNQLHVIDSSMYINGSLNFMGDLMQNNENALVIKTISCCNLSSSNIDCTNVDAIVLNCFDTVTSASVVASNIDAHSVRMIMCDAIDTSTSYLSCFTLSASNMTSQTSSFIDLSADNAQCIAINTGSLTSLHGAFVEVTSDKVACTALTANNLTCKTGNLIDMSSDNSLCITLTASNVTSHIGNYVELLSDTMSCMAMHASNVFVSSGNFSDILSDNLTSAWINAVNATCVNGNVTNIASDQITTVQLDCNKGLFKWCSTDQVLTMQATCCNMNVANALVYACDIVDLKAVDLTTANLCACNATLFVCEAMDMTSRHVATCNLSTGYIGARNIVTYNICANHQIIASNVSVQTLTVDADATFVNTQLAGYTCANQMTCSNFFALELNTHTFESCNASCRQLHVGCDIAVGGVITAPSTVTPWLKTCHIDASNISCATLDANIWVSSSNGQFSQLYVANGMFCSALTAANAIISNTLTSSTLTSSNCTIEHLDVHTSLFDNMFIKSKAEFGNNESEVIMDQQGLYSFTSTFINVHASYVFTQVHDCCTATFSNVNCTNAFIESLSSHNISVPTLDIDTLHASLVSTCNVNAYAITVATDIFGSNETLSGLLSANTITSDSVRTHVFQASNVMTDTLTVKNGIMTDTITMNNVVTDKLNANSIQANDIKMTNYSLDTLTAKNAEIWNNMTCDTIYSNKSRCLALTADVLSCKNYSATNAFVSQVTAMSIQTSNIDIVGTCRVNNVVLTSTPPGSVMAFAGSNVPEGWLLCDGAMYSTSTYNALFDAIGYTFGGTSTRFAVPVLYFTNVLMLSTTLSNAMSNMSIGTFSPMTQIKYIIKV